MVEKDGLQEEGRLSKVKRMFTNSLRKPAVNKTFAVNLEEVPVNKESVPKVLIKTATYIETYGKCFILFTVTRRARSWFHC